MTSLGSEVTSFCWIIIIFKSVFYSNTVTWITERFEIIIIGLESYKRVNLSYSNAILQLLILYPNLATRMRQLVIVRYVFQERGATVLKFLAQSADLK